YHPHGDQAIYDAMVRMAQDFSLRVPLVDGYGNFGSLDGDKAAAMRYSEVRLQPEALLLLEELKAQTVEMRPNFDGTLEEPVVLPAAFPQLLVNGCAGIAVGMATHIPPHHPAEVLDALLLLIDQPEASLSQVMRKIKGPDFPTGGEVVTSRKERQQVYEKGQGNFLIRATWKQEEVTGRKKVSQLIVDSIPYAVSKATVVEKVADVIVSKKLPGLLDVRDESTEQVSIVLEIKNNCDPALIMAYLYKHTPLMQRFSMNMTVLVPTENPLVATPKQLSLKELLEHFRKFRLEVIKKRFRYELEHLHKRIHLLEGFRIIFDDLDKAIQIIRHANGRKDSGIQLRKAFPLSEAQTQAILDTRLYRISRLEVHTLREEWQSMKQRAAEIETILASPEQLSQVMRDEFAALKKQFRQKRRTRLLEEDHTPAFSEEDFIQNEDTHVCVSQDGWVKRVRNVQDINSIRVREGDRLLAILPGNTREMVVFFTSRGSAYTMRIWDVPATSGYGIPLSSLFAFADGECVLGAASLDSRFCGAIHREDTDRDLALDGMQHLIFITQKGVGARLSLALFTEPSTKNGRRFTRLTQGDSVILAATCTGEQPLVLVSEQARYLFL
ncbi:MAG: DNA gyrase subunit A, partial [Myxococcota bacterium]